MAKLPPAELLADLESEAALRTQRDHDRDVAKLKGRLRRAEQKLSLAERDLELAREQSDFLRALDSPSPPAYEYEPRKASGAATAVLVLGDWHVEETVDPATINGKNEYNLSIAERRIKRMFAKAAELIEAERGLSCIKDLVVAVLGDMITGQIHEELAEENSLSPTEASLFAQDHIAGGIDFLLKHSGCKSITVPTCYGNHGRTTQKPRTSTAYKHSYEWLLYNQLERYYRREPRVTWKVDRGYHNWLTIQGKRVRFHHGDWIRYAGGVGGLSIPVNKAINEWNKTEWADFDFFQHWHQHIRAKRWSVGNCLIGYNAYALSIKAEYSKPTQTLAVFDKRRELPVVVREVYCE